MTEEIVSYGVLSLIPAILAVVLAFWTKNVIISLMASLFVGCLITAGWNPWNAMQVMFSDHLFVDMTGSSRPSSCCPLWVASWHSSRLREEPKPLRRP